MPPRTAQVSGGDAIEGVLRRLLPSGGSAVEKVVILYLEVCRERFAEPHRHYHGMGHIESLLGLAEKWQMHIRDFDAVLLAILFHDLIYDVGKHVTAMENERRSALWFLHFFNDALAATRSDHVQQPPGWLNVRIRDKVVDWILATANHLEAQVSDRDGQIFLDMDLGILGFHTLDYQKYAAQIRLEYSYLAESDFIPGRSAFLRSLQGREIYRTEPARRLFSENFSRNIAWELQSLKEAAARSNL